MAFLGNDVGSSMIGAYPYVAGKFTAPETGVITSIFLKIYQHPNAGNVNWAVGIYTDNSGSPGTLLNNSSNYLMTTQDYDGFIEITIPSTSVISSTIYWIVAQSDKIVWRQFYYNTVVGEGNVLKYISSISFPDWTTPNPTMSGELATDNELVAYGTIVSNTVTKTILSDVHFKVTDIQKTILSDVEFTDKVTKNILSDVTFLVPNIQKTILSDVQFINILTKTILSDVEFTVIYESKYIHNNYMYIVTDTVPAKLIKVNIEVTPPTYTIYTLNLSGEDYSSGKDLCINYTTHKLYASFNNGIVGKISLDDPNNRESIYVGENEQLIPITHNPDYLSTFISDNDLDSLFVIDESTYETINTDFRFLSKVTKTIKNILSFVFKKTINTDFRFLLTKKETINTDFRFNLKEYGKVGDDLISVEDFTIKINGVAITDFVQTSIRIMLNADEKSQSQFTLVRKHDKLDYTLEGGYNQITNNNEVEILINNVSIFVGKINQLYCSSSEESVIVYAKGNEYEHKAELINLSLSTLNEQIHPYHILIDTININNPYIDPLEENPEFYKGITVDLGIQEQEIIYKEDATYIFMTPEEFENFIPDQNYTYFWYANGRNFITGWSFGIGLKYIGTSLASLYSDTYEIEYIGYKKQRIYDNLKIDLGNYILGSPPYKEISVKNGRYNAQYKWEDKADGLYDSFYNLYNFISYTKKVAMVEYEKIKNVNGAVLPRTSASISLTIDAFLYYKLKLLNRINIVNTTESGIYENNNGFPLSIKSISIDSGQMKVGLEVNNEWANSELDALDATLPKEPEIIEEVSFKVDDKYDLPKQDYIE